MAKVNVAKALYYEYQRSVPNPVGWAEFYSLYRKVTALDWKLRIEGCSGNELTAEELDALRVWYSLWHPS